MWHMMNAKDVENKIRTSIEKGLSSKQVEERRKKYGINQLEEQKKQNIIKHYTKCIICTIKKKKGR